MRICSCMTIASKSPPAFNFRSAGASFFETHVGAPPLANELHVLGPPVFVCRFDVETPRPTQASATSAVQHELLLGCDPANTTTSSACPATMPAGRGVYDMRTNSTQDGRANFKKEVNAVKRASAPLKSRARRSARWGVHTLWRNATMIYSAPLITSRLHPGRARFSRLRHDQSAAVKATVKATVKNLARRAERSRFLFVWAQLCCDRLNRILRDPPGAACLRGGGILPGLHAFDCFRARIQKGQRGRFWPTSDCIWFFRDKNGMSPSLKLTSSVFMFVFFAARWFRVEIIVAIWRGGLKLRVAVISPAWMDRECAVV
jgi:hypothetical protein